jgi:hypothetical protein
VDDQLAALGEVGTALERERIAYWLFGGWAVDFYVGSVTRAHDDVDIAVWLDCVPRIAALLEASGWHHAPEEDEDGGTGYERGGVRLELTFLVRDGDGRICIPLRSGLVPWSDGSFGEDVRELDGVHARVIALAALKRGKSVPRDDPDDAGKDRTDYERLSGL